MYYPPPEKGTNWAAVIAGLAALGIGAYAVYWMWENGYFGGCKTNGDCPTGYTCINKKCVKEVECNTNNDCPSGYECVNHKCVPSVLCNSDSDCQSGYYCVNHKCVQCRYDADCPPGYKCIDNKCVRQFIPCSDLNFECLPGWAGLQRCDSRKNLCRCNGSQWDLLEENSQICINSIKHLDCFVNPQGEAICYNTYKIGADACDGLGTCSPCPCGGGVICMPGYHCCQDNRCRISAGGYFYATNINGLTCWRDGNIRYARYDFDSGGIQGFKKPVEYHQLQKIQIFISGTQYGFWDGVFYDNYNYSGWREVHNPLTDPCIFGCASPLSLGSWFGGSRCMDSFLVGIASPTGPPDITAIGFTF